MIFLHGASLEKKLEYAIEKFYLKDEDIFGIEKMDENTIKEAKEINKNNSKEINELYNKMLEDAKINLIKSIKCINKLENFTYNCILENKNVINEFQKLEKHFSKDFVVISHLIDKSYLNDENIFVNDNNKREQFICEHNELLSYIKSKSNKNILLKNGKEVLNEEN